MRLVKASPFQADVLRLDVGRPEIPAVAIVKTTFDLDPSGRLSLAAEQMPLIKQALTTPFGIFHGEYYFKKEGADLCVLGTVRRSRPVEEARVRLTVGPRAWELLVRGDRRWRRSAGGRDHLIPSRPQPFTELPLDYAHAFGGQIAGGDVAAGYAANPQGRGYYQTATEAEHQPLPNIEAPDVDVTATWRPEARRPVGWGPYPNFWALRGETAVGSDPKTNQVVSLSPSLFNHAHPDLILEAARPGDVIAIEGLLEEPLHFRTPAPPASVLVKIGATELLVDAPIDGLFLWVDERKLVVTQRARFRYERRPKEQRTVHIDATVPL